MKNVIDDETGETKFDTADMLLDGAISGVFAYWGNDGASYGNTAGINASWKQLFKKGLSDSNALKYFYKNAHNSNKKFVLTALEESTGLNTAGTITIGFKNKIKEALGW